MKKFKIFLFSIIILISSVLVPVISKVVANADVSNIEKNKLYENIDKQNSQNFKVYMQYSIKSLEKYENNLIYKLSYPIFEDKQINFFVDDLIKGFIESFKLDFIGQKLAKDEKFIFKLDTDIGEFQNKLLFLKFNIQRNYNTYPNPIKSTKVFIIDLNTKKSINIDDFLKIGYKELFFGKVKLYFYNNYAIKIDKKSENYNDIKPSDENYNKIFLKNDKVNVFFYDYKKDAEETISFSVDEIYNFIKPYYLTLTKNKQETTTLKTTILSEQSTVSTTIEVLQSIEQTTETTTQNIVENNSIIQKSQKNRLIDKNKPIIALTFDDGPNAVVTNRILEILEENNSVATFFVNARRLDKDKETIKKMDSIGCQIGNHTANHKNLTKISDKEIKNEIDIINKKMKSIIGKETTIVRVPYAAVNNNVKKIINYPLIMWSIDTKDWKTRNSKETQNQILNKVKDGDIILMHDLYKETADACEVVIPKLIQQGFQLVTIDELFYYKEIQPKNGEKYFNGRKS